jgi:hypothetical protein
MEIPPWFRFADCDSYRHVAADAPSLTGIPLGRNYAGCEYGPAAAMRKSEAEG